MVRTSAITLSWFNVLATETSVDEVLETLVSFLSGTSFQLCIRVKCHKTTMPHTRDTSMNVRFSHSPVDAFPTLDLLAHQIRMQQILIETIIDAIVFEIFADL